MPLQSKFGDEVHNIHIIKRKYVPKDLARAAAKSKTEQSKVKKAKPKEKESTLQRITKNWGAKDYKKKARNYQAEKRNYERTNKGFFGDQYTTYKEDEQIKKGGMGI